MNRPFYEDESAFASAATHGLTKREYFIAQAMLGLLASGKTINVHGEAIEVANRTIATLKKQNDRKEVKNEQ